jgi:hypothetical protein
MKYRGEAADLEQIIAQLEFKIKNNGFYFWSSISMSFK